MTRGWTSRLPPWVPPSPRKVRSGQSACQWKFGWTPLAATRPRPPGRTSGTPAARARRSSAGSRRRRAYAPRRGTSRGARGRARSARRARPRATGSGRSNPAGSAAPPAGKVRATVLRRAGPPGANPWHTATRGDIFRARCSLILRCPGTADAFRDFRLTTTEWRAPLGDLFEDCRQLQPRNRRAAHVDPVAPRPEGRSECRRAR